jgi:hypothetical protein
MKPLSFQPTEIEAEFIYENIKSWSKFCHDNLKREMDNNRFNKWNAVSNYLLIMVVGLIISFLGLIVIAPVIIIASIYLLGGVLVVFGTFGIIGVYRYG